MTLVDVLAAVAIIAATVATLAPLAVDARSASDRSDAALRVRAALSALAPPREAAGERTVATLPEGCRLRWHSLPLPIALGTKDAPATARMMTMQVVSGLGEAERVMAERSVPMLIDNP